MSLGRQRQNLSTRQSGAPSKSPGALGWSVATKGWERAHKRLDPAIVVRDRMTALVDVARVDSYSNLLAKS